MRGGVAGRLLRPAEPGSILLSGVSAPRGLGAGRERWGPGSPEPMGPVCTGVELTAARRWRVQAPLQIRH